MSAFRKTKHRKFFAWLGLLAMWLTIAMPAISRNLPSGHGSLDLGAWCTGHGLSDHHPSAPSAPDSPTDKCSYCSLLCHSPLVVAHADLALPSLFLSSQAPVAATVPSGPPPRLLSAHPRGPPSLA